MIQDAQSVYDTLKSENINQKSYPLLCDNVTSSIGFADINISATNLFPTENRQIVQYAISGTIAFESAIKNEDRDYVTTKDYELTAVISIWNYNRESADLQRSVFYEAQEFSILTNLKELSDRFELSSSITDSHTKPNLDNTNLPDHIYFHSLNISDLENNKLYLSSQKFNQVDNKNEIEHQEQDTATDRDEGIHYKLYHCEDIIIYDANEGAPQYQGMGYMEIDFSPTPTYPGTPMIDDDSLTYSGSG